MMNMIFFKCKVSQHWEMVKISAVLAVFGYFWPILAHFHSQYDLSTCSEPSLGWSSHSYSKATSRAQIISELCQLTYELSRFYVFVISGPRFSTFLRSIWYFCMLRIFPGLVLPRLQQSNLQGSNHLRAEAAYIRTQQILRFYQFWPRFGTFPWSIWHFCMVRTFPGLVLPQLQQSNLWQPYSNLLRKPVMEKLINFR